MNTEQEFNQGIEELKDHIHTLAWRNRKETFYCGEIGRASCRERV